MQVSVESIKALREQTGAGIMECKTALEEVQGDLQKAEEILRNRGVAIAAKKASRETREGVVETYIHSGSRIGALVEVNCETDFVARTTEFQELAHNLAMQIAAMSPLYVDEHDIPEGQDGNPQEICLLQQPFIKDPTRTVQDLITEVVGRIGENIRVRRFARFGLGE